MRCPSCGVESPENVAFCARCGFNFHAIQYPGPSAPRERRQKTPDWVTVVIVLTVAVFAIAIISWAILQNNDSLLGLETGSLSVTITNHDFNDREISIYIDGKHSTDKLIPAGYQWTGLIEFSWSGADPIKEISVISGAGTESKQVQIVKDSIVSVSFELY